MYEHFFKRLIDIVGALFLLPFVLLVILVLAPFIWLTDKGPIFYNATRAGKDYKPFKMFKLRSMYVNSPDMRNADGSTFNSDNDPRVTPIGKLMRKTSLDEFPQFLNVLFGDMSFIGPRPTLWSAEKILAEMDENRRTRYRIRPGITGYAQAYFRNSIDQDEKFKWDAYYVEHVSLGMDVKILCQTTMSVLKHENVFVENEKR